jgi:hypothetical protein
MEFEVLEQGLATLLSWVGQTVSEDFVLEFAGLVAEVVWAKATIRRVHPERWLRVSLEFGHSIQWGSRH